MGSCRKQEVKYWQTSSIQWSTPLRHQI